MVIIQNDIYLSVQDLLQYGYTETYLNKVMSEYRSGRATSYANITDPNDGRKRLIAYASIPSKAITERSIPSEQQIVEQMAINEIENAVIDFAGRRTDQALNFFKSNPNTYPYAQELSTQSSWLLFLAQVKPSMARALGCGSVEDLQTKVIEVTNTKNWERWKVNSLQVLSRKIKPFKALYKKPLNGNYTDEQFEQALVSLVHGNYGNKNREKLTEQQEAAIFSLYADGNVKLTETQVYSYYLRIATEKISAGEWTEKALVSESTIKNFLNKPDIKQAYWKSRHGKQAYRNSFEVITRRRPASIANGLWVMDGTPVHRYYMVNGKGQTRLNVYVILDAHSWCVLGFFISEHEDTASVIGALRAACQLSGYMPHQIQFDHSSANFSYHAKRCIETISRFNTAASVGNARAKIVEPFFKQFNSQVLRFRPGYAHSAVMGNNINSKPNPEALTQLVKRQELPSSKEQAIKELHEDFAIWNHKPFNGSKSPLQKYQESIQGSIELQRPLTAELLVEAFYTMPGTLKQVKGVDKQGNVRQLQQFFPREYNYTNGGVTIQVENRKYDFLIDDSEVNGWLIGRKVLVKYDSHNIDKLYLYQNTAEGPKPLHYNDKQLIAMPPHKFSMAIMDREDGESLLLREHLDRKKIQEAQAQEIAKNYIETAKENGTFVEISPDNAYPKDILNAAKAAISERIINGDEYKLTDRQESNPEEDPTTVKVDRWDLE